MQAPHYDSSVDEIDVSYEHGMKEVTIITNMTPGSVYEIDVWKGSHGLHSMDDDVLDEFLLFSRLIPTRIRIPYGASIVLDPGVVHRAVPQPGKHFRFVAIVTGHKPSFQVSGDEPNTTHPLNEKVLNALLKAHEK